MKPDQLKSVLRSILRLPFCLLYVHILMLGMAEFYERHPRINVFMMFATPVAILGVFAFYGVQTAKGFWQGVQEARESGKAVTVENQH